MTHESQKGWALPLRDRGAFLPVAAPLPIEMWVQGDGFAFGLPFGWRQLNHEELTHASKERRETLLAGAVADRTDLSQFRLVVMTFAVDDSINIIDPPQGLVIAREHGAQLKHFAGPFKVRVAGVKSIVIHLVETEDGDALLPPAVALTEVWMVLNRLAYAVAMSGPQGGYDAYLPSLFTALGSWRWQ